MEIQTLQNTIEILKNKNIVLENILATNNNKDFYTPSDMHCNGLSEYENIKATIRFNDCQIEELTKQIEEEEKQEKKNKEKAEKRGITVEELLKEESIKAMEKAKKAKIKRYEKELKDLEERKAYLIKWLAENK